MKYVAVLVNDGEFALIFRPTSGILQLTNARGVSPRWEGVRWAQLELIGLCIKVGRGQGDGDMGTRVWGLGDPRLGDPRLGTWERETRDLGTSSMGRWDAGLQTQGRRGR